MSESEAKSQVFKGYRWLTDIAEPLGLNRASYRVCDDGVWNYSASPADTIKESILTSPISAKETEHIVHLIGSLRDEMKFNEHMAGFSRVSSSTKPGYTDERYLSEDYRSIFKAISDMMACEYHEPGTRGKWAPWTDPPAYALNPRAIRVSAAVRQAAGSEANTRGGTAGTASGDSVIDTIDTTSNRTSAAGGEGRGGGGGGLTQEGSCEG